MSIGPFGDMYVVIGHKNEMRADKKWQTVTFKTNYFTPAAYNTLQEAEEFVSKVKHAYSADIVRLWNPIDRDALLKLADEIEDNDVTYCVSTQYVLDSYARRIREACGEESKDET